MKLQENLSCRKGDGGSFFHTSYGVAQIQIKRATVKVRQGKIYVGKLPTEVSKSKQINKHVTFDAKKKLYFLQGCTVEDIRTHFEQFGTVVEVFV